MVKGSTIKKILITGGNGYIGCRLALELAQDGHRVTPLCFPAKPENQQWLDMMDEVLVGDITDLDLIDKLTKEDYEVIIHLVSLDHRDSESAPDKVAGINVMPLWNLLYASSKRGTLKKLIYFSTVQIYGRVAPGIINEQTPLNPVNVYGLTHYMCEQVCNFYNLNSDIDCINVRLSNSYAAPVFPDANCWWLVINDLCRQAVQQQKIVLTSDGRPQRDFIFHDDLSNALKLLIDADSLSVNTFNLSSGNTYTIMEIANIIRNIYRQQTGKELPIITPNGLLRAPDSVIFEEERVVFDNSLLKKTTGFSLSVSITDGIAILLKIIQE